MPIEPGGRQAPKCCLARQAGVQATSFGDNTNHDIAPRSRGSSPTIRDAENPLYSIYNSPEKWFIVFVASLAAFFSPLSGNIYLPAVPIIAAAFDKPIELINLSVTMYMVLQGVSPMLWGSLADRLGRRPILLSCLLVLSMACLSLALVPTSDYWLLMLLRSFQAAGSASTFVLGSGIIADITTRAERGSFYALYLIGPQFGPAFGPLIGAVITQTLGWRWMFWILCILSTTCLLVVLIFFPETLRLIVGNGSIIPSKFYRPLIPIVGAGRQNATGELPPPPPYSNPLRILTYLDVMNLLIFNGVLYSAFCAMTATISILYQTTYPFLNEIDIGLCFLAVGGGTVIGSLATGRLLDRDYKRMKEKIAREALMDSQNMTPVEQVAKDEGFPIERVRMRFVIFHVFVYAACCAGYGWCLEKRVKIAIPLVLQATFAISGVAVMNTVQTLLTDLLPMQGSSVTACNNLVRCSMGAATVSIIQLILDALGTGWTYVLLGGICITTAPMIWFAMWVGPRYRAKRRASQVNDTN